MINIQNTPDYKKIYRDMIELKYPEKKEMCSHLFSKKNLSTLDIIEMSQILLNKSSTENSEFNQSHRSYNKSTVFQILEYQKRHNLNNSQLAKHFKLSRNTVIKWKSKFLV